MDNLHLEGTAKTPYINFDAGTGVLLLQGRSIPENSIEFFSPLNEWLEAYGMTPSNTTTIDVKLEYFNTSSSKCILDLFKRLENMNTEVHPVKVNWYFEEDDEDMEEAGEDYQAIINLPFEIIEVDEM
ncbi:MAG: DUF1987 domain-containing protein [Crocinitomicaceae bacterium]|nr:DUF1987 domain-containing protein [Crocinitomicaceae bacterium]